MITKIEKSNVQDIVELSPVQEGMLFHYLKEPESPVYNIRLSLDIKGHLNVSILQQAIHFVQDNNEMLRCGLRWDETRKPVQIILKKCPVDVSYLDVSHLEAEEKRDFMANYLEKYQEERFDLRELPFRISLIQTAANTFILSIVHHHVLYDGWSTGILLRELFACYHSLCASRTPHLPSKPGYKDTWKAVQKNALLQKGDSFWNAYLKDYRVASLFPSARVENGTPEKVKSLRLTLADVEIRDFSNTHRVTMASVIYTAYAILLQRYTDTEDIVFGTVVSGRDSSIKGSEDIIGNFINTLALRFRDPGESSILEAVRSVNRDLIERDRFCATSYSALKQIIGLKSIENLFDSVIVIENYPLDHSAINSSEQLEVGLHSFYEHTDIPVMITVFFKKEIEIVFSYKESSTENIDINQFAAHFLAVLVEIPRRADLKGKEFSFIPNSEKDRILIEFNASRMAYPQEKTLAALFEAQVGRTPDRTALELNGKSLSYAELNEKANGLAATIREKGARPNQVVALYTARSLEMFIGIIAVLKSGAAYLPLDPAYPAGRIAYMLEDSGASLVIASGDLTPPSTSLKTPVELIRISQDQMERSAEDLPAVNQSGDLAYLIYTSGSTGLPKGVMLAHRSVHNYIASMARLLPLEQLQTLVSVTTYSFDIFVTESLLPLLHGLTVVIADEATQRDPGLLNELIISRKVQVMQSTPSRYQQLLNHRTGAPGDAGDGIGALTYLLVGGELFPNELFRQLKNRSKGKIINVYGPTETTVWSTLADLTGEERVVIGKPIGNTAVYILDSRLRLQPTGVAGELYIGGDGLAVGYWNNELLTEKMFIPNPFDPAKRIYKTGDMARWLPDGNLEYIGRTDAQVKIRGHRIEMGEIESQLLKHPDIAACAVTARKSPSGEDVLCAYYTSGEEISPDDLRDHLASSLPEQMIPAHFSRLAAIPYTSNGKIDRKALPDPKIEREEDHLELSGELQPVIAEIWAELLNVDKRIIGANSNFFNLGGHSLNATSLVGRIHRELHVRIPLNEVFKNPTVAGLSACIRQKDRSDYRPIPRARDREHYDLSSSQLRQYFLYELDNRTVSYNVHLSIALEGNADGKKIQDVLARLISRHESLRTSFRLINNKPVQVIADEAIVDLQWGGDQRDETAMINGFRKPFQLDRAPLFRAGLFHPAPGRSTLLIDLHHIIADKLSIEILRTEFNELYKGRDLPPVKMQYRDYSEWQNSAVSGSDVKKQEAYWMETFSTRPPVLRLPADWPRNKKIHEEGGIVSVFLKPAEKDGIDAYCHKHDLTPPILFYSLFSILLSKLSGQEDIVIGVSMAGRSRPELEGVIGMFVNVLPVRSFPEAGKSLTEFTEEAKTANIKAYENQDCQLDNLIEKLDVQREPGRNPLFDVLLNFLGKSADAADLSAGQAGRYEHFSWTNRFDLTLNVSELPNTFHLQLQYDSGLFGKLTAERFLRYLVNFIPVLGEPDGKQLSAIDIERKEVIDGLLSLSQRQENELALLDDYFLSYWRRQLSGGLRELGFPTDRPRAGVPAYTAGRAPVSFPLHLTEKLSAYGEKSGIPASVILMAAFKLLLSRYCRHEEIVIGSLAGNNPIVLRSFIDPQSSFDETVASLHRQYEDATKYGAMPFDRLVKALVPEKDPGRNALFDVLYHFGAVVAPAIAGLDMNLFLRREGPAISGDLVFNSEYFDPARMETFVAQYLQFTANLLAGPNRPMAGIEMLSDEDKRRLLHEFDGTGTGYPKDKTIIDVFRQQVQKNPGNIAVKDDERTLRYDELDKLSGNLAYALKERGVSGNAIIGLLTDRSIETIIGMLAILKAGGAYLPIDPEYPRERKEFLIRDSGTAFLVTTRDVNSDLAGDLVKIYIEDVAYKENPDPYAASAGNPGDLCYIIYTSGTTGNPKGVMVENRNVVRLLCNDDFQYDFNEHDVWTMFHSQCFDVSVWEMYGALFFGGKLIIIPKMTARDTAAYLAILKKEDVTILNQTPSAFYNLMSEELASADASLRLRYIIFAGEALSPAKLKKWRLKYPATRLVNMYGITETTVHVTYKELGDDEISCNSNNVGKPIPTLSAYILDDQMRLVPHGIVGELYVGGAGVARGYWGRKELTEKRFIADPYRPGERLYKSGDLVRALPSGEIGYLGRADQQVQLRGFRIEPGEIEAALVAHPAIKEAVVLVKGEEENKFLVGYYVAAGELRVAEIRSYLGEKLPEHMIPAYFVHIDRLPLTTNGKLDKKALPEPRVKAEGEQVAPVTKEEILLVNAWSEVLGVEKIGVADNFFALGGDSIKCIQVCSRVRNEGYALSVKDIFVNPTIRELAFRLKPTEFQHNQETVTGTAPLSPVQHWLLEDPSAVANHHFNQSVTLSFPQGITKTVVERIFASLLGHHDALRMVFRRTDGGMIQHNPGLSLQPALEEIDLRNQVEAEAIFRAEYRRMQSEFDLEKGPLVKPGLFHRNNGSDLVIIIHHLVTDGVSWRILLEDIATLYRQIMEGEPLVLPRKTQSYLSWSRQIAGFSAGPGLQAERGYWDAILSRKGQFPLRDNPAGGNRVGDCATRSFSLDAEATSKLLTSAHRPFGTQIVDLLLASLMLCLHEMYGHREVKIDLEGHGRESGPDETDISRTVGWFTSIYPVMLETRGSLLPQTIKGIKEGLRGVPNKGAGYLLLRYPHSGARICFNYLGQYDPGSDSSLFRIAPQNSSDGLSPLRNRRYDWEVTGVVAGRQLNMSIVFSEAQYLARTMDGIMDNWKAKLKDIIDCCCTYDRKELTPSDLTYKQLSEAQLDQLQQEYALEDIYPLSPMQEGMLFHTLADSRSRHYFEQIVLRINGRLDIAAIERSLQDLTGRYGVLRTLFLHNSHERPLQVLLKQRDAGFSFSDLRDDAAAGDPAEIITACRLKTRQRGFDLSIDPLIRLHLFQTGEGEYELLLSYHHLVMDGWCLGVILKDFRAIYTARIKNTPVELPTVKPYATYIGWLERREKEPSADYWKQYLTGYESLASLPDAGIPTAEKRPYSQAIEKLTIARESAGELYRRCGEHGVTLTTILQCCWSILLSRYNHTDDVVFGSVVSGRPAEIEGIERMAGLFINTVPVRITCRPESSFDELITDVQRKAIESEPHHYHSLAEIQALSGLRTGLLDHIMIVENYPIVNDHRAMATEDTAIFAITDVQLFEQSNYDLSIVIIPGETIEIKFTYNSHRYDSALIAAVTAHFDTVLRQVLSTGKIKLAKIRLPLESFGLSGKADDQTRIGTNRIDLWKIRNVLMSCESIYDARVIPMERNGDTFLVAYYTSPRERDTETIRRELSSVLPDYLVPAYFIQLTEIPLSPDGKPDRDALPEPEIRRKHEPASASAQTKEKLVEIWAEVLKLKKEAIRVDKNFLEMGGHSLKAAAMVNKIHNSFSVEVPIMEIFHKQNIENLADYIMTVKQMKEGAAENAGKVKITL